MYISALNADIGGFEARSMGHGDCLNVYYLGLGPIDHFERERERECQGVCRERILHFDLEGQKGTALRSFLMPRPTANAGEKK